jgi:A/G-specific adenine glycosylase
MRDPDTPAAGRTPSALGADAMGGLFAWYAVNGRDLAFRRTTDPYAILVSEVMAQQTQIGRVVEAWRRWLIRFPTIEALAAATPADVVRAWQGMGYNRRALNLWRAAIAIRDGHGGRVPRAIADLEQLPGIGPYTARAVAAIAFGEPVAAVDTNVRRVLGRVLGLDPTVATGRSLQSIADASVDRHRPAAWTHAVMDLGATICRPGVPRCSACPLQVWCAGSTSAEPPRSRRPTKTAAFPGTSRWLRGRILDRLRDIPGESWHRFEAPIGDHPAPAVRAALRALARDGLVELRVGSDDTARLPLS